MKKLQLYSFVQILSLVVLSQMSFVMPAFSDDEMAPKVENWVLGSHDQEGRRFGHRHPQLQTPSNDSFTSPVPPTANGIIYHGGPIMLGTTNVYYIWYGSWSGNTATTLLPYFAAHIGGTKYFNMDTTYTDSKGNHVSNSVRYAGSAIDNYSHGSAISDADVQAIVLNAIAKNRSLQVSGKMDPKGVYFVLSSADVSETSGFCTAYCGWHTSAPVGATTVKYAFVGNAEQCPSACAAQTTSPNKNLGADAMASTIAHELQEAVSDPELTAWYDSSGWESGDKCAWDFGTVSATSSGAHYNITLNGTKFLIQQNWVNAKGGYCAMGY